MATFNPQYVNLDRYEAAQIARRANQQSPLDAALQGLQQGVQLVQLPQQIQDQQLQRQLNNALLTEKLNVLQNPDADFNRRLQRELIAKGALDPNSGIYQTPTNLIGQTIANPGAITAEQQASLPSPELLAMRQTALDQAGVTSPTVVLPTAQAGLSDVPITGLGGQQLGLTLNPNIPKAVAQNKADLQTQLAMLNHPDRQFSTSEITLGMTPDGKSVIVQNRQTGNLSTRPIPGSESDQGPSIIPLPKITSGGANRPLTANERVNRANKAGEQGLTEEQAGELITTPEAKAAYLTGLRKRDEIARTVGVKDLAKAASKTLEGVQTFQPTFDLLQNHYNSLVDQGLVGLIPGNWAAFKNYVSGAAAHPDLKAYQDELEAFTGQLKGFTNDPGVMTDQDQKRIAKALGDITKDPRVAAEKFSDIQEIIDRNGTRASDFLEGRLTLEEIGAEFRNKAESRRKSNSDNAAPIRISTIEERNALKAGTKYIGPDGLVGTR